MKRVFSKGRGVLPGGLIELFVIVILASAGTVALLASLRTESLRLRAQSAASQLQAFGQFARDYVQNHEGTILVALTSDGSATNQKIVLSSAGGSACQARDFGGSPEAAGNITAMSDAHEALDALPCLHETPQWADSGLEALNGYQQTHHLLLERRGTPGTAPFGIQMLLFTEGGRQIPTNVLTRIASYTAGIGGLVGDLAPYSTSRIRGGFGSWNLSTSYIPSDYTNFGAGHLALYLGVHPVFRGGDDFLSRQKNPPWGNTMEKDLEIRGRNIRFTNCTTGQTCQLKVWKVEICNDPARPESSTDPLVQTENCSFLRSRRETLIPGDFTSCPDANSPSSECQSRSP